MGTYRKNDRTEYISGNTARKLNSLPAREEMLPERRTIKGAKRPRKKTS